MAEPTPINPVPPLPDLGNEFNVVGRGDGLVGVYGLPIKHLTPERALNLAAWLIAEADPDQLRGAEFYRLLQKIRAAPPGG